MKTIHTYEEAVAYLLDIPRFTKKNTMEDTKAFLNGLGLSFEHKKIIHVAGTNGKGSVCYYLSALLKGAGKKVGLFTSPHLVDIRERFLIDGNMPTKEAFFEAFSVVYDKVMSEYDDNLGGYHPTFFEFLFFVAMLLFNQSEVEYLVLETGLGGLLDATNSIDKKDLTIITKIGLDHTQYLGNTPEEITVQKAGILRENTPVLYYGGDFPQGAVIEKCAKEIGAITKPIYKNIWKDVMFRNKNIDFSYNSRYYDYIAISVSGIAFYQVENVSMALAAFELLLSKEEMCTVANIQEVLRKTVWQGRMEEVLPDVFLDGAHNENGIDAFLDSVGKSVAEKKTLLFSMVSDKDYESITRKVAESGLFDKIVITRLVNDRALDVQEILQNFKKYGRNEIIIIDDVEQAFCSICREKTSNEQVFVAGSLYLVGKIKEIIGRNQNDKF